MGERGSPCLNPLSSRVVWEDVREPIFTLTLYGLVKFEIKLIKIDGRFSMVRIRMSFLKFTVSKAALTSRSTIVPPESRCLCARGPRSAPSFFGANPNWVCPNSLGRWGVREERKKEERVLRRVF